MNLIMEDYKSTVNALEEVKKLQDLVRKLEIQNLQLRSRQNLPRKGSVSPVKDFNHSPKTPSRAVKKNSDVRSIGDNESNVELFSLNMNKDEYFDDLEIIRVSDIEMSDDESWLYTSPKSIKQDRQDENPSKWLRKDVDDPENKQLQFAKKALLSKLNELELSNKEPVHHAENLIGSNLRRTQMLCKSPHQVQKQDSIHVDSRTFTRSKKKEAMEYLEKLDMVSNENLEKSSIIQVYRRGSDVSSDSISYCHILEDANDVQEVARMQEESLRMSSPLDTPKRGSGSNLSQRTISASSRGSTSDQDVSDISVFESQNSSSSKYEYVGNTSTHVEPFTHSDHSSPSESPYGSNASLHNAGAGKVKLGTYRRSLPNLNGEPLVLRQSKTKILNDIQTSERKHLIDGKPNLSAHPAQKVKKETDISRVRQSKRTSPHVSSIHSPETSHSLNLVPRSADPVESRLHSRSALPRPSRASSASRSNPRSGIPMPSMMSKKRPEDSWSEGCF